MVWQQRMIVVLSIWKYHEWKSIINVTIKLSHLFLLLLIIKEWRKERVSPLLIGRGLSRESLVSSFFVWSPPPYILDLANGSRVSIHRSLSIPIPIQFRLWCGWQTITSKTTITTGVAVSSRPWSWWSQSLQENNEKRRAANRNPTTRDQFLFGGDRWIVQRINPWQLNNSWIVLLCIVDMFSFLLWLLCLLFLLFLFHLSRR